MPLVTTTRILAPFLDRLTGAELDALPYGVFRFTFTHSDLPRTVQIRMYYAARTDTIWIFTALPDGSPIGSGEGIDVDAPQEQAKVA